ncbi:hypothetical protein QBC32DRAFT_331128 [Pseudoneurospora amorphoporcata]|uniref:DUF726-domain-containing protein n=1 Tax=Pseudoneurospora amorphoporcata TaxID=241081 RepID=A0AAN6SK90_9PEZI|nr:hypothetical protein QBC32DRAFT_331128 [Pseudoneurospora amorphoporcata]
MPGLGAGPAGDDHQQAAATGVNAGFDSTQQQKNAAAVSQPGNVAATVEEPPELDDFGLPIRTYQAHVIATPRPDVIPETTASVKDAKPADNGAQGTKKTTATDKGSERRGPDTALNNGSDKPGLDRDNKNSDAQAPQHSSDAQREHDDQQGGSSAALPTSRNPSISTSKGPEMPSEPFPTDTKTPRNQQQTVASGKKPAAADEPPVYEDLAIAEVRKDQELPPGHNRQTSIVAMGGVGALGVAGTSGFSHQQLTLNQPSEEKKDEDDEWQEMPAYAPYDIYDDDNKLIAREHDESEEEKVQYAGLGGAGKGYTRVLLDDDAESQTSMDENTQYLFKDPGGGTGVAEEDDVQRDAVSQLQATKELLTEGQRIAYVGLTRLELSVMVKEIVDLQQGRSKPKKEVIFAAESMRMWSQKMMMRLYSHMDISPAEQIMIEQLAAHGVMPQDLTPVLMANARVKNPMADEASKRDSTTPMTKSSRPNSMPQSPDSQSPAEPPPPYSMDDKSELTEEVRMPSQMPTSQKIDIDLRWTVLCDLFLVLVADSIYDARSRTLLERVAKDLEISWVDICRFEKKVTDALEMQQAVEKENWNEEEHKENRRKMALKKRYIMMGLATVGGGLVIGLSAGLLAPVIGAGLAAGLTTIGVGGTTGFLAGAGGAAIITSSAAASGSIIGVRAANRRTGAVKTFEYRPLHNNKRVNLIVTVSGWMTGKVDDVRLPFSTVDPLMGDIYSVLWEPEMLTSMGDTINILATEALTQGLQQLLGNTILMGLMSAIQLPVVLTKLSYLIDNPWAVSLDRATAAGLILADSLIDRNLGTRPVTLVGYSLGSRVIYSCLQELARKGAFGLVQNVYLFGSPIVVKTDEYLRARAVVSGRFVNGYNRNDWILGYLFRLTNGGIRRIGGLAPIEGIAGVENFDVTEFVVGHMDYRTAMPRLLRECGWMIENDEFVEIEEPDPENHQERQRELINEIEEARKELEKEGRERSGSKSGGAFSFFRKKSKRQEWEVYEDSTKGGSSGASGGGGKTEDKDGNNHGVLFDVDAIRAELAKEAKEQQNKNGSQNGGGINEDILQVKEIKSTLPPMKLDVPPPLGPPAPVIKGTRDHLRETRSASLGAVPPYRGFSSVEYNSRHQSTVSLSNDRKEENAWNSSPKPSISSSRQYNYSAGHGKGGFGGGGFGADDYGYSAGKHDDDAEIQMTFDTAFEASPPPRSKPSAVSGRQSSYGNTASPTGYGTSSASASASAPARPEIKSAQTVPVLPAANNPWADFDDDDDFGKEKEISMTFA